MEKRAKAIEVSATRAVIERNRDEVFLTRPQLAELCASSSAKGDLVAVGKNGKAYSQTPEARLRQPEPRREIARALTPSQSNRFVKKPSSSL